ncbi:nicotinamide riboside transporter PnuC [Xanthomonas translucens]|uniref:nicotinamide riboside transporter PnuC n=2 Tax=Xanthomonas campestris pv. translucens TaxID=343 RepID=UPI0002A7A68B|nr:nicotinamide riboside transporter PnuC [Xanthomonas translucens]AKK68920.1 aminotransferase [Xanthomonas translucens pv. undulosa]ELP98360.1 transporter [Xanthomonas translucens DAR61454]MBC3973253.1 nicotinamide mononucleotide transporter [Xanthomonas translucens pv. undulosa]MCT8269119.1 nicotinamide riboside transporter PnuC [Xanthomonas translucens pv. undulosa]MCT8280564.1 nicotinamide riboside transporter PnuC [Xanthomonas translucens pv. undulosa]
MSPLELLAVLVNILGVWLTARRVRWCWPVNVVAVLLYAWLFYQWKLYSDMLLQGVYVVLQGYGWWRWSQGRLDHGKVQVGPLPRREGVLSLLAGAAGALSLGWLMHRHTDAALPWLDAALSAFSLVASVWAARKRIANWTLWIVLDSLYVGVFVYKGLYPTAALYAGFVLLAIYGLRLWQAEQRGVAVAAP